MTRTISRSIAALVAAVLTATLALVGGSSATTTVQQVSTNIPDPIRATDILVASAIIRLDHHPDGTPDIYLLDDAAHALIGVSDVEITSGGRLLVTSSKPGPVIHVAAVADETLGGRKGLIIGTSGGGPGTNIWFYDTRIDRTLDLSDPNDYDRVAHVYANLWFKIEWYVPVE